MPEISYKTKEGFSSDGKRKVYFTCHPDDFDRYFDNFGKNEKALKGCERAYEFFKQNEYSSYAAKSVKSTIEYIKSK